MNLSKLIGPEPSKGWALADVLKAQRFVSGEDLEQTIMRYIALNNTQFPQSALGSRTAVRAMKDWHKSNPELFVKKPSNRPGCYK